jgi:hypothetical protein
MTAAPTRATDPAPVGFRLPRLCLPRPDLDLARWAVVACDQYTAEPEYWRQVEAQVGEAPSTLRLIFPEVHLGAADAPTRIANIQQSMRRYLADGLLQDHEGPVFVEREVDHGVRRGLLLELDLEHYDFGRDSTSLIRPTEGTMVERLAPRIAVRREAELELPHILVLIDDPAGTVIEPLAAERAALTRLYDSPLMQGGRHIAGYAVDAERAARAVRALQVLADPQANAARYGVAASTPPMLFAVGDGNHSLATAKAIWEQVKAEVGPDHPCRHALVEVENIHDPALAFEPIHRLLFGVAGDLRQALVESLGPRVSFTEVPTAAAMRERLAGVGSRCQCAGLIGPGARFAVVEIVDAPSTLAVGTLQPLLDDFVARRGASAIDYVHGDDVLERLAVTEGHLGVHLATVAKSDLLRMVVREGPLPRKTFSMGEAHEKRFYVEARRIRRA